MVILQKREPEMLVQTIVLMCSVKRSLEPKEHVIVRSQFLVTETKDSSFQTSRYLISHCMNGKTGDFPSFRQDDSFTACRGESWSLAIDKIFCQWHLDPWSDPGHRPLEDAPL